jgi:hypothetical protein
VGHSAILVSFDEKHSVYSVGILVLDRRNLRNGRNGDKKRSVSMTGQKNIRWIAYKKVLPKNGKFLVITPNALKMETLPI